MGLGYGSQFGFDEWTWILGLSSTSSVLLSKFLYLVLGLHVILQLPIIMDLILCSNDSPLTLSGV